MAVMVATAEVITGMAASTGMAIMATVTTMFIIAAGGGPPTGRSMSASAID